MPLTLEQFSIDLNFPLYPCNLKQIPWTRSTLISVLDLALWTFRARLLPLSWSKSGRTSTSRTCIRNYKVPSRKLTKTVMMIHHVQKQTAGAFGVNDVTDQNEVTHAEVG